MRNWILGIVGLSLLATGTLVLTAPSFGHKAARAHARDEQGNAQAVSEMRAELAQLRQRVGYNETTTEYLSKTAGTRVAVASPSPASPDNEASSEATVPARPNREQQTARFEKRFEILDNLRGASPDPALESKFRDQLDAAPKHMETLRGATVNDLQCGNKLCRMKVTFPDASTARLGQNELQIQLGSVISHLTAYMAEDGKTLLVYATTDGVPLPPMPAVADGR